MDARTIKIFISLTIVKFARSGCEIEKFISFKSNIDNELCRNHFDVYIASLAAGKPWAIDSETF